MHNIVDPSFLGIGLSSRKNLCIHPDVSREKKGKSVDARCRDLTNGFAKARNQEAEERGEGPVAALCSFHEELGMLEEDALIDPGVWTLEEIKEQGKRRGTCPYFALRRMVSGLARTAPACEWRATLTTGRVAARLRQRRDLLVPLPVGSQGRGAGLKGDEQRLDRRV